MQQVRRIKVGYATRQGRLPMEVRDVRGEMTEAGFDVCDRDNVTVSEVCLVATPEGGGDR